MPEGYELEMGYYWGLFTVRISVFNDDEKEELLRRKLESDSQMSIYVSISRPKKDFCLTDFYSMLIALSNSKFFGADNINTDASTTGEKCRFKWAFKCRFFVPSIYNYDNRGP